MPEHCPEDQPVQDDIEDHRVRPGVGRGCLIARTEAWGRPTAVEVKYVGLRTGVVVEEQLLCGRGEVLQGHLFVERAGEDEEEVRGLPAEVCKPVLLSQAVASRAMLRSTFSYQRDQD